MLPLGASFVRQFCERVASDPASCEGKGRPLLQSGGEAVRALVGEWPSQPPLLTGLVCLNRCLELVVLLAAEDAGFV